jgi:hypothetical protein
MKRLTILALICFTVGQSFDCLASSASEDKLAPNMVSGAKPSSDSVISGVALFAYNLGGDEAKRLAKDGIFIGRNSVGNYIDLEGGNILLNPDKDIVIGTRLGDIKIRSGAIAFIMALDKDIVVYNLFQTQPKQVCVTVNKHKVFMEPEHMLVLTIQDAKDFENLKTDCHRIAYSNVQPLDLNGEHITKGFVADFSVGAAVATIEPLKQLAASNNREDKTIIDKILKGSAHFATGPEKLL